jgi:hypothetical protein
MECDRATRAFRADEDVQAQASLEQEPRQGGELYSIAVGTLARLVDDVLVIGRTEATDSRNDSEPFDLGRFTGAVWREVSVALRSKQALVLDDRIGTPIQGLNDVAMHTINSVSMFWSLKAFLSLTTSSLTPTGLVTKS